MPHSPNSGAPADCNGASRTGQTPVSVTAVAGEPADPSLRRWLRLAAGTAAAGLAGPGLITQVAAQAPAASPGGLQEGRDYRLVKPQQPTDSPPKIEVIEFFWYGCPHCNAFEPSIKEWSAKLPSDVAFRKVHVNFQEVKHQQLYYTLEAMGKSAELNDKVFQAIHVDRNRLDTPEKMAELVTKYGLDKAQFLDTFKSFSVQTRMRKATSLQEGYKVDGVPALGINGKYYTAPSMVGGNANALKVVDLLVDRERGGKKP